MNRKHINIPDSLCDFDICDDGTVINVTKGIERKPRIDKRRPNQPSVVTFPLIGGGELYRYIEELVAEYFIEGYNPTKKILHINGDIRDCSASNLKIYSVDEYLKDIIQLDVEWKRVDIGIELLFEYYISDDGILFNGTTFTIVKPFEDHRDPSRVYYRYNLYLKDKTVMHYSVARLVAIMFLGYPEDDSKDQVYFKDDNTRNWKYTNLAWGDRYDVVNNSYINNPKRKNLKSVFMKSEKWKRIDFLGDLFYEYEISNYGRCYNVSHNKMLELSRGAVNINNQSWLFVNIRLSNGNYTKFLVHRLVATAFLKNPDPSRYVQVNHINGNPECNWVINLEWCTLEENMRHALSTNLLHSSLYNGHVTDVYWRTRIIIAWLISIRPFITDADKYQVYDSYKLYLENYPDTIMAFNTYDEFMEAYRKYSSSDEDFKTLFKFYQNQYA